MLSADAMVIQVVADRVVQLARQGFESYFDRSSGKDTEGIIAEAVLTNLYAKAGDISKSIIAQTDKLHTCLILIEEMEKK